MKSKKVLTISVLAAALIFGTALLGHAQEYIPVSIKANNHPKRDKVNSQVYWRNINDDNNAMIIELVESMEDYKPFTRNYTAKEAENIRDMQYTPGVAGIASYPAGSVSALSIQSSACGIAIEPVEGDKILVSYAGVKDKSRLDVSTAIIGNTLFISVYGKAGELYYIDPTKGARVNTILVQVPDNILKSIVLDDTTSLALIKDTGVPITAATVNGMVKVHGTNIQAGHTLSCVNGDVILLADHVGGQQKMSTVNGDVRLVAETVSGKADLTCINGDVSASVGGVTGTLNTECTNGDVSVKLTKTPTNLTFTPIYKHNADVHFPKGYEKAVTIGQGKAKINMKTVNGSLFLDVYE